MHSRARTNSRAGILSHIYMLALSRVRPWHFLSLLALTALTLSIIVYACCLDALYQMLALDCLDAFYLCICSMPYTFYICTRSTPRRSPSLYILDASHILSLYMLDCRMRIACYQRFLLHCSTLYTNSNYYRCPGWDQDATRTPKSGAPILIIILVIITVSLMYIWLQ